MVNEDNAVDLSVAIHAAFALHDVFHRDCATTASASICSDLGGTHLFAQPDLQDAVRSAIQLGYASALDDVANGRIAGFVPTSDQR